MHFYRVEVWYEDERMSAEDRAVRHIEALSVPHAVRIVEEEMKVSLPIDKQFRVTAVTEES